MQNLSLKLKKLSSEENTLLGLTGIILLSCLMTAIAQGSAFFYCSHYTKILVLALVFFCYGGLLYYLKISGKLSERTAVFMMILLGTLLRCSFVLLSGLYERQHDAGAYTGMGTDFVNPGHIGYIEYIYKFHKLPDINPYQLFGYYHPPLHHILSFIWLQLNIRIGVCEELAFENLQILPLLYSCLCMVVTWRILRVMKISGRGLLMGLALIVFHPATIIMAGSVNNDMLTVLFMCLILLFSLEWIRRKDLKGLIKLALAIGFGMITKLNSAVLAIPLALVFLSHFVSIMRRRSKPLLLQWIKNYLIFGLIVCPIGLSWIVRNLIRFGEKPGVPVPGVTSSMYAGNYSLWERLGIPSFSDWRFSFPFHPISAKACNNTWVIMFHTALFGEEYPTDLPDILLVMCQAAFILSVILGIITAILLLRVLLDARTDREDTLFLLSGYLIILVSFAAFVIKYPYTCSCDFRYVVICLVYISIALGLGNVYYQGTYDNPGIQKGAAKGARLHSICMKTINGGLLCLLSTITLVYIFWNRY